jgi:hypothetical protein
MIAFKLQPAGYARYDEKELKERHISIRIEKTRHKARYR